MKYCKRCFYPDTKPDLWFDKDGICAACIAFHKRTNIDWKAREKEFAGIAADLRKKAGYHCIVPVSGGKDSTAQVLKCLEYGLNPLAVNVRTDDLTQIGRDNLDNIANLGVDLIEVHVNEKVRRAIAKYGLETVGDISWAEHITIFTVPFKEAWSRGIDHIFWGENSQNEYGGPEKDQGTKELTTQWVHEFGGLNGLRRQDLIDAGVVPANGLMQFSVFPQATGIRSLFMGYYFPWSGLRNAELAREHGFKWYTLTVEGNGTQYENLDNYQTGLHDYFKYLKFGYGRATDIANNNIRRGLSDRELGREFILAWDGKYGDELCYLGRRAEDIVSKLGVSKGQLWSTIEKFTNKELFEYIGKGQVKPKFLEDLYNA